MAFDGGRGGFRGRGGGDLLTAHLAQAHNTNIVIEQAPAERESQETAKEQFLTSLQGRQI